MKIGDKVVCVDDDFSMHPRIHLDYQNLPVKNQIYTIRETRPRGASYGVLLEEIRNKYIYIPSMGGYLEPAFSPYRFRPLDDFIADIEIKIDVGIGEKVEAEWTPDQARCELQMIRQTTMWCRNLREKIQQQTINDFDLKFLSLIDRILAMATTIEAISLLDQGPVVVNQAGFEVQDEVMRISVLRTRPEYWEEPDRKLWLEAEMV